jgi:hypothetical protein
MNDSDRLRAPRWTVAGGSGRAHVRTNQLTVNVKIGSSWCVIWWSSRAALVWNIRGMEALACRATMTRPHTGDGRARAAVVVISNPLQSGLMTIVQAVGNNDITVTAQAISILIICITNSSSEQSAEYAQGNATCFVARVIKDPRYYSLSQFLSLKKDGVQGTFRV